MPNGDGRNSSPLVSLLATDIVDSTRLWARHEAAMRDDLATHDALIDVVVRQHRGEVFKHTGDGMFAAFDDPIDAIVAAAEVQRAIGVTPWTVPGGLQVRAAVHAGVVHRRNGDMFGSTVNRTARVLAICPPGAVVVSGATAGLLTDRTVPGLALRPVGSVTLKGLDAPDRVHAVDADHLVHVGQLDDRIRSTGRPPIPDTEMVGRSGQLHDVVEAVRNYPLVSIVGVGGMGKTRLAIAACEQVGVGGLVDEVLWCDLSTATGGESAEAAVLNAIGTAPRPGRTAIESAGDALGDRRTLLVLDNCEHVLTTVTALVRHLRSCATNSRVLTTSREALGAAGERPLLIGPLPPDEAMELFAQRATEARRTAMSDDERDASRQICDRLDGIPLAIELAAARTRVMSVDDIAGRLDDRFRFLRGGRSTSERHQTLQSAIEWSYSLLDHRERGVFECLSVFSDGSGLEGVSVVCELDEYDALDALDRLVSRSLVIAADGPVGVRYRQLETLRQFGEQRLLDHRQAAVARDRHLVWALQLAASLAGTWGTSAAPSAFATYVAETENLRMALQHAAHSGRRQDAYTLLSNIAQFALYRPNFDLATIVDPATDGGEWTDVRAEAASWAALFSVLGEGHPEHGVDMLRRLPDAYRARSAVASIAATVEVIATFSSDAAQRHLDRADRSTPDAAGIVRRAEMTIENIRILSGELSPDATAQIVTRSRATVAAARAAGDGISLAATLGNHSLIETNSGDPAAGLAAAAEGAQLAAAHGARLIVDGANANGAWARAMIGEFEPRRLLALAAELRDAADNDQGLTVLNLIGVAAVSLASADPETSYVLARFLERSARHWSGTESINAWAKGQNSNLVASLHARSDALDLSSALELTLQALDRAAAT